ncbi:Hypothetical protein PHPALM_14817 [Phytophthora palmivora]|uniref:Uncharacterized protein n=1 Tax=Phytophthora palmivora TaxID=4796 RepID=A0A2P4XTR1_9STRA|nr:Hypothetical protein PHPALM_14817 [Phytophthora palmivora]
MTRGTSTLREDSPATAKGSPHASAAGFADSADSATAMTMDATADGFRSVQFTEKDAPSHARDEEESDDENEYEEKAELGYVKTTAKLLDEVGELSLLVDLMGVSIPVEPNLAAELGEYADYDVQGVAQREPRWPLFEEMMTEDSWESARIARIRSDVDWLRCAEFGSLVVEKY